MTLPDPHRPPRAGQGVRLDDLTQLAAGVRGVIETLVPSDLSPTVLAELWRLRQAIDDVTIRSAPDGIHSAQDGI